MRKLDPELDPELDPDRNLLTKIISMRSRQHSEYLLDYRRSWQPGSASGDLLSDADENISAFNLQAMRSGVRRELTERTRRHLATPSSNPAAPRDERDACNRHQSTGDSTQPGALARQTHRQPGRDCRYQIQEVGRTCRAEMA